MNAHLLAIDQGTTGTTVLVVRMGVRGEAAVVGMGKAEFRQSFPQPGWVEHDLFEIWESVRRATQLALDDAGLAPAQLAGVAVTNQRETCGLWKRADGVPVGPAIVWQDRRTADACRHYEEAGHGPLVRQKTGLVIDPYFSATKLAWMLDADSSLRAACARGELLFGTVDTWLVWQLSGHKKHVTDVTNASRTLLYDVTRGEWDDVLCNLFGNIPKNILPEVVASDAHVGHTEGLDFLPDGLPLVGVAGDQHAALFGQSCLAPHMAKCTYGTGAFLLINTGDRFVSNVGEGLLATPAWKLGNKVTYALEGSVFVAGAMSVWLRDGLGLVTQVDEIEALASSVPDAGGVVVVPALTGLGAPYWRPEARGLIAGLTRGTQAGHVARAALEGIAWQVHDLARALGEAAGAPITQLLADGGASANGLLMQYQADILQIPIVRPALSEATALGAALLAAHGLKLASFAELASRASAKQQTIVPTMSRDELEERRQRWETWVLKA